MAVTSLALGLLTGCTASFAPQLTTVEPDQSQTPTGTIQGSVHGGQNPVTGGQIYLYQAGPTGYGTAATSLICNKTLMGAAASAACASSSGVYKDSSSNYYVTTDINGDFALTGDYVCTPNDQVYMVALGGNPGLAQGGYSTGATFLTGSSTITVPSPTWVNLGMTVSGAGLSGTVTAVTGTTVTLSQKTTAGSSENITLWGPGSQAATTATFPTNSSTITVASSTGITTGMTVLGAGLGGTVTAVAGTTVTLSQKTSAAGSAESVTFSGPTVQVSTGATFPTNSSTITVSSATNISTGMLVSGGGVGGTVTKVTGTTITLSQNTTAASVEGVTFSVPATTATYSASSSTITVTSTTGMSVGMSVSGTGLGGTITAINGTQVSLSQAPTSSGSLAPITVGTPINNAAIVQMAALGQCPGTGSMASQVPWLVINEASTVAFAYSVSGFATTPYNVSTSATQTGITALANAFANASAMVATGNGLAPTTIAGNTNISNPYSKINTLANILSTCVNTSWSGSSNCASLYKYATTLSGTPATDEGSAIFNIAHNQALQVIVNGTTTEQNAANLLTLSTGASAFSPMVNSVIDWTMPVIYKGVISTPNTTSPPTSGPYNIAFDAYGNAWIGDRGKGVVEIEPLSTGAYSASSTGFTMVKGVAVSPQDGTIWVSDFGKSVVDVLSSSGTLQTTIKNNDLTGNGPVQTGFTQNPTATGGDNYLAFEVNETTASIVILDPEAPYGVIHYANNSNYTYTTTPGWLTIDSYGAAWMPSVNNGYVANLSVADKNGTQSYPASETNLGYGYTATPELMGTAGDSIGNIWAATGVGGAVLAQFAGPVVGGQFYNGGMNNPEKTFVDGNNTVWVANGGANVISALDTAVGINNAYMLSSVGFATSAASQTGCTVIGVDLSGNVWVGNSDQSVSVLIGLGTPTAAPLYAGTTITTGTGGAAKTVTTNGNLGMKP